MAGDKAAVGRLVDGSGGVRWRVHVSVKMPALDGRKVKRSAPAVSASSSGSQQHRPPPLSLPFPSVASNWQHDSQR